MREGIMSEDNRQFAKNSNHDFEEMHSALQPMSLVRSGGWSIGQWIAFQVAGSGPTTMVAAFSHAAFCFLVQQRADRPANLVTLAVISVCGLFFAARRRNGTRTHRRREDSTQS
jgi:hypothetical protein